MNKSIKYLSFSIIMVLLFSAATPLKPHEYPNPAAVNLYTVSNYAALASTAVTSPLAGTNLNGGDLGITGIGCTDFPIPCQTPGAGGVVIGGAIITPGGAATTGQTDATAVVTDLNGRVANTTIAPGGLTGLTLDPGVYDVTSAATDLTGNLTLNGDANSIFIFRFSSTFITSGAAQILFSGGARNCNVYWTSTAATFNDTTRMAGTVFGATSVTFPGGGAVVNGRVIAQTAAVNFNNTTINNIPVCVPVSTTTTTTTEEESGGKKNKNRNAVGGLPDTGGAPIRTEALPWSLVLAGGVSAIALVFGVRSYRRTHRPKQ